MRLIAVALIAGDPARIPARPSSGDREAAPHARTPRFVRVYRTFLLPC